MKKGRHSFRKVKRAWVLFLLSYGLNAEEISSKADVVLSTVYKVWNRYLEVGKDARKAIEERPRSGQPAKLSDEVKAQFNAIACSDPPEGRDHWTLQMICNKAVELGCVENISTGSVRYLKKLIKPWRIKQWVIGEINEEYIQRMEHVLDTYKEKLSLER